MIKRYFTDGKRNPYTYVEWQKRNVKIPGQDKVVQNIEFPVDFSDTECSIAYDKYFKMKKVPCRANSNIDKIGTQPFGKLRWKQDDLSNMCSQISFKQLVHRIVGAWAHGGFDNKYFNEEQTQVFYDEAVYLIINQMFAPNSPQWFNTGLGWAYGIGNRDPGYYYWDRIEKVVKQYFKDDNSDNNIYRQQVSGCYIHSIDDSLLGDQSITDMLTIETKLFRNGSGNGFNISNLRAEGQPLSSGGKTSGVMSFLKIFDKNAQAIKSGGKTRRSAANRILNIDHPEIQNFIEWKVKEERKIRDLITGSKINVRFLKQIYDKAKAGKDTKGRCIERLIHSVEPGIIQKVIDAAKMGNEFDFGMFNNDFNGQATKTVSGQNANNNIAISDSFMVSAIRNGKHHLKFRKSGQIAQIVNASDLLNKIRKRAWQVGDPGLYYIDNTNAWNTCLDTRKIEAANPCQEFLNVNNTSCNLASVNLIRFKKGKTEFNRQKFCKAIEVIYLAAEISNSIRVSPSKTVAQGTAMYRPIGIGFMNLGALLMSMAIPYDSAKGNAWGRIISALMTGTRYKKSVQARQILGRFPLYEFNKDSVNRVIQNHYNLLAKQKLEGVTNPNINIDYSILPGNIYEATLKLWKKLIEDVKKFGVRNNAVTCIRPTGTIGLLMDSSGTMSSEPQYTLIRSKKLHDGGHIKTASGYVQSALKRLEYTDNQIQQILNYVDSNRTIEARPYIKRQHLSIFDCAVPAPKGNRSISVTGHLNMMSAINGFISMGISKTVNMPSNSKVKQIRQVFEYGWKIGIKALTIFRDGCRLDSPMKNTKYDFTKGIDLTKINEERKFLYKPVRRKMPQRRKGYTQEASIRGHKVYIRTGQYDDGTLGEIFIDIYKQGSFSRTSINLLSKLASKRLQYGVPREEVIDVFLNVNQEPKGMVNHPNIKMAQSIFDFIGRLISYRYLGRSDLVHNPDQNNQVKEQVIQKSIQIREHVEQTKQVNYTGQECPNCGSFEMIRNGTCHVCKACGTTTGCS